MNLIQAGVIPFRRVDDDVEFLVVTSKRGKWIFPKGIVEPGESLEDAAEKEGREEAGVRGRLVPERVGSYIDRKWRHECEVVLFLLEYDAEVRPWEEAHMRERRWCPFDEAYRLLKSNALRDVLYAARARIAES